MKIYRARAFTYTEKIEGREVIGNPASVVVCEKDFPSKEEMRRIVIEEGQPVSVFLKRSRNIDRGFDVRYFFPDGKELSVCGHGSLATAKIIYKLFGYNNIMLIPNAKLLHNNIILLINGNKISIKLPTYKPKILNINYLDKEVFINLLKSLDLKKNEIKSFFLFEKTNEYVLEIDADKLKSLNINFEKLARICNKLKCLSIFITAKSNIKGFDYETRVFAPHCNLDEDIVCGSSNSVLTPFWANGLGKKNLRVLFPYKYNQDLVGGVINIEYNKIKNNIILNGEVNCGKL